MDTKPRTFEQALVKALQLRDSGKSKTEILNSLPEFRKELGEIFQILNVLLSQKKEEVAPEKSLLAKVLSRLPRTAGAVTNTKISRYQERGDTKGRPSHLINQIYNLMVQKLAIGIGIVVVLLLLVFSARMDKEASLSVVPATGDVSDVLEALLADSANEQSVLADEGGDTSLVNTDSQAIDGFGQSYENEF